MSDRIAVLYRGRLEQIGPPGASTTARRTASSPDSSAAMNLIEGRIAAGRFTGQGLDLPLAPGPAGGGRRCWGCGPNM
ncbi:MAG: hypothetical protein KatS3mg118_1825 [Paracoccaceae bacterium]|nr:MAG: hypothetical protein KatS3mg118_1825 [Paracoccaceae bacterium]